MTIEKITEAGINSKGEATAWVSFDSITNVINSQHNVATLTDLSIGITQLTFLSTLADAKYPILVTGVHASTGFGTIGEAYGVTQSTTSVTVSLKRGDTGVFYESDRNSVCIFGGRS